MTHVIVVSFALLTFLCSIALPEEIIVGKEYVLNAPNQLGTWYLCKNGDRAVWMYRSSPDEVVRFGYVDSNIKAKLLKPYKPGTRAKVAAVGEGHAFVGLGESSVSKTESVALVVINEGDLGWVPLSLLEVTPEEKKLTADEAAKIAAMPKLQSTSDQVLVATSLDCANDLQKIVDFGKKNGTGVEFRRKLVELSTLGCSKNIPAGTPITIVSKPGGFVSFRTYPGNVDGIALQENVR
jgi:hypothetical protein